ncbi:hypothetical protein N7492_009617 [Penicillium capsulatum]|uniref:Uncharacterized protein n=1 Tax=Penicillium capsulatum TaxID=69766 RepID=A0A9W9HXH3_9EURO|nr:hypothetical protein N7492_009617 [Penicillium capsulatum]KAJ6107004.1 hypothetical protein N7512_010521 [Penicillium capsulatum]
MAITELIFPSIKTDPKSLEEIETNWPTFSSLLIDPNPGLLHAFRGWVVSEEDKDVTKDFKEFLLFEWKEEAAFHSFVTGQQFATFASTVRHLLNGPPTLQLFDTNVSPKDIGLAPVMEVIRVPIQSPEAAGTAVKVWKTISQVVMEEGSKNHVLHGTSTNLENSLFVGIVGWASPEESFQSGLNMLSTLGDASRVAVEVSALDLPALQEA